MAIRVRPPRRSRRVGGRRVRRPDAPAASADRARPTCCGNSCAGARAIRCGSHDTGRRGCRSLVDAARCSGPGPAGRACGSRTGRRARPTPGVRRSWSDECTRDSGCDVVRRGACPAAVGTHGDGRRRWLERRPAGRDSASSTQGCEAPRRAGSGPCAAAEQRGGGSADGRQRSVRRPIAGAWGPTFPARADRCDDPIFLRQRVTPTFVGRLGPDAPTSGHSGAPRSTVLRAAGLRRPADSLLAALGRILCPGRA